MAVITGTFTGVGASSENADLTGAFNLSIYGINPQSKSRINLERSFDSGVSWRVIRTYDKDTEATDTEPEATGVNYRLNCTHHQGGPIEYRFGN
jgi:hypothetical protein